MTKQAKQLMKQWEAQGMNGFFMDFFVAKTGLDVDTVEYEEVYELLVDGKL